MTAVQKGASLQSGVRGVPLKISVRIGHRWAASALPVVTHSPVPVASKGKDVWRDA